MNTMNKAERAIVVAVIAVFLAGMTVFLSTLASAQTIEIYTERGVTTNQPDVSAEEAKARVMTHDAAMHPWTEPTPIPSLRDRDKPGWVPPESKTTPTPTPAHHKAPLLEGILMPDGSVITAHGAIGTKLFKGEPTPAPARKRPKLVRAVLRAEPVTPWTPATPTPSPEEPSRRDKPLGLAR
jgi:hypothetical protein